MDLLNRSRCPSKTLTECIAMGRVCIYTGLLLLTIMGIRGKQELSSSSYKWENEAHIIPITYPS